MNLLDLVPGKAEKIVQDWVSEQALPRFRASQIFPRLWQRPVRTWGDCSDLPKNVIQALERDYPLIRPNLLDSRESPDRTIKYLWEMSDGAAVESVVLPDGTRRTVCISSQVGCAFQCSFCATGKMGFVRNLSPWEITAQVRELAILHGTDAVNNVVFMGMGEPLHNWPAVDVALTILNDPRGLGIGARKITVSTVGIVPKLQALAKRPEQFRLALSVHSPIADRRRQLVPAERRYPLKDVLSVVKNFSRRVTFEYIMIQGVNDRQEDIAALAEVARPIGAMVNLLPLHPGGPPGLQPTPRSEIHRFAATLRGLGVNVTVRRSRGVDIEAACGQLWTDAARSGKIAAQQHGDVQK
jgi:23S rRNA (adenine2503-C2)-methyltransferase